MFDLGKLLMSELKEAISMEQGCACCGAPSDELHHIRTKKSGGPDKEWNLLPVCRGCHRRIHDTTLKQITDKSARLRKWLYAHGWYIENRLGKKKWWNDKLHIIDAVSLIK